MFAPKYSGTQLKYSFSDEPKKMKYESRDKAFEQKT